MRALVSILLALGAYGFATHIVPRLNLPEVEDRGAEPTLIFVTPTPTATSALALLSPVAEPWLPSAHDGTATPATTTPTPSGSPTPETSPTPEPTRPPAVAAGCANPGVQISSPGSGAAVAGSVAITGTANIEGFQFYKVEVSAGEQPGAWTVITGTHSQPVSGGLLDTWNTSGYPAGTYWLRLVVVDQTGNYPSPCSVRVTVAG